MQHTFVLCGNTGVGTCDMYKEPEKWIDEALDALAEKTRSLRDTEVFRPVSVGPWPFGVHFIDTFFGAEVYDLDGSGGNWQVKALETPVGVLKLPNIDSHPSWIMAKRLADAFIKAEVKLPFFTPPVLSSPFNNEVPLLRPVE